MAVSMKPKPIAEQEELVAKLQAELDRETAKLAGMMAMASWAAAMTRTPTVRLTVPEIAKGRQKGSIAKRWRRILWNLQELGGSFTAEDIVRQIKDLEGRDARTVDARRQMEAYADLGYIVRGENGRYDVTSGFTTKFPFEGLDGSPDEEEPSE